MKKIIPSIIHIIVLLSAAWLCFATGWGSYDPDYYKLEIVVRTISFIFLMGFFYLLVFLAWLSVDE